MNDAPPQIALDSWTVQVRRDMLEMAGMDTPPGDGPYVTIGLFEGPDAEEKARTVVAQMHQLVGVGDDVVWAWSGADILDDRRRRGVGS